MTDDEAALLRTIRENPTLDAPRLVYADFIEESGDPDRAEYIRISCEFDERYPEECIVDDPYFGGLLARMIELDRRYEEAWWPRETCGHATRIRCLFDDPTSGGASAFVRRGFICEIRAPLAWLIGQECEACGPVDGLNEDFSASCPTCHGTGRTPGHLREIVRVQPITRVTVTDREPSHLSEANFVWVSDRTPVFEQGSDTIPESLFSLLQGGEYIRDHHMRRYPTREAARLALSDACLAWAEAMPDHGCALNK